MALTRLSPATSSCHLCFSPWQGSSGRLVPTQLSTQGREESRGPQLIHRCVGAAKCPKAPLVSVSLHEGLGPPLPKAPVASSHEGEVSREVTGDMSKDQGAKSQRCGCPEEAEQTQVALGPEGSFCWVSSAGSVPGGEGLQGQGTPRPQNTASPPSLGWDSGC